MPGCPLSVLQISTPDRKENALQRKGGKTCFVVAGDNRFSSIMGGKGCFAVCPSDMAIALTALDAEIVAAGPDGIRTIPIRDFYTESGNILGTSGIITEFHIKPPPKEEKTIFLKFRLRDAYRFFHRQCCIRHDSGRGGM